MIRTAAYVVAVMLAAGAGAQELPRFDEAAGFDVIGIADGDALVVKNAGHAFYCGLEEGDGFLVLADCWPVLGPQAAQLAAQSVMGSAEREGILLDAVGQLPDAAFFPAIVDTMRAFGCVVDFSEGEEVFIAALATRIASQMGHDSQLSEDARDKIGQMTEDAADTMLEMGRIEVDRDTATARLVECE